MKIEIVFIDDSKAELEKYLEIFKSNAFSKDHFNFHIHKIDSCDIRQLKFDFKPDLFLVDYRFDLPGGEDFFYDGNVLSTALRNFYPETPIILFTRRDIFDIQKFPKSIVEIVDDIYYKNEFLKTELEYFSQILSLALGYKALREYKVKIWDSLLKLVVAPKESEIDLLNTDKPFIKDNNWSVIDCAKWIRKTILKYPGILYNELHAATFLGISIDEFINIQEKFKNALYSGIFKTNQKYFWKSQLRIVAVELMKSMEINTPIHIGFKIAYEKAYNNKLKSSICIYSREENADKVCYVLNKPVKTKYSFKYNIDDRPNVMDEARVSWLAIRTTDNVNEEFLSPIALEMLPSIKSNKKK